MLTRYDPFQEMMNLRRAVNRMFENSFDALTDNVQTTNWGLALDLIENDDAFIVKASVPGINPDDLEITFTDSTLTIKGETKSEENVEKSHYHLRERRFGSFTRSIQLGTRIESDKIEANYDKGVLTLRLPKSEEIKPKRIPIKGGSKLIEGKVK
jgi:HSP20 family protein